MDWQVKFVIIVIIYYLDKLYITHGEWSEHFGGVKKRRVNDDDGENNFKALPFDSCALSLAPFRTPVCTPDGGVVFELLYILPYLERNKCNPVTGEPLEATDLIRLNYSRNDKKELYCPITFKTFTNYSSIVANRVTGNVYSAEGIEQLKVVEGEGGEEGEDGEKGKGTTRTVGKKQFKDFYTNEPFLSNDIITLQDPKRIQSRNMNNFWHLKQGRGETTTGGDYGKFKGTTTINNVETTTKRPPSFPITPNPNDDGHLPNHSKGLMASALTSTSLPPKVREDRLTIDDETKMLRSVKGNGKATIRTNFGDIHVELFCSKTPKTTFNFITLARRGYYAGVKFHRLLPGFIIQGGDPSGTGAGGESCWGRPFPNEIIPSLHHDTRGILSMANKATPNTNTSQFFITFSPALHLDRAHPIFGKVIGGWEVLDIIEFIPTDSTAKPLQPILIQDIIIVSDPFEEYHQLEERKRQKHSSYHDPKNQNSQDNPSSSRPPMTDPTLMIKRARASINTPMTIGKYLFGGKRS